MRGLVMLGMLAGAGWYAYRKLMGGDSVADTGHRFTERMPPSVRQVVHAAATKVQAATAGSHTATDDGNADAGSPAEARAAAMAGAPAVQPPASIPEPSLT
jgi:hypothetical protein